MFLFGIGFRDSVVCMQIYRIKRISAFIIDDTVIRFVVNTFDYGFVLNQVNKMILGISIS